MHQHIVIINGPAGVGKTTVGRQLARLVPNGVCIHGDTFKEFIVSRVADEVAGSLAYVNGATIAVNYIRAGYERVVFEFVFEHQRHVRHFLDAFALTVPVHLFTLWAPLEVILVRESTRQNREHLGERVEACYRALEQRLDELGTIIVNNDESTDNVAERIHQICAVGPPTIGSKPNVP